LPRGNYGSAAGVAAVFGAGTRLAQPGRIYAAGVLNGQLDLTQAESIADLVERDHPKQLKLL